MAARSGRLRRLYGLGFALALVGTILAGCGGGAPTQGTASSATSTNTTATAGPQKGGTLTVALDGELDTLDPQKSVTIVANQVERQLYESLVVMNKQLTALEPQLATSWDQPDPLTYVFHLRKDVKFSNGQPFTAKDVMYTFNRLMDPKTGSPRVSNFTPVKDVAVVDDYTVKFTLKQPYAPFLSKLESLMILPSGTNVDFSKEAIGTGPFKFSEWVRNDHITLERNPSYWQKDLPYLDKVIFKPIPEAATRVVDLKTGAVDILNSVPFDKLNDLKKTQGVQVFAVPGYVRDTLGFNTTKKPFNDPRVRQAVAYAIDRATIAKDIMYGFATPSVVPVPTTSPYYDKTAGDSVSYNLDKAKQLLSAAGYPNGFSTTIKVSPTYPEEVQMAQLIQQSLDQIGIKAKIEQLEWSTWIKQVVSQRNFDIEIVLHSTGTDPDDLLYVWTHSKEGFNFLGYSDPKLDSVLEQGRALTDLTQRKEAYSKAEQLFVAGMPWTNIDYRLSVMAASTRVHDFIMTGRYDLDFRKVWVSAK